MEHLNYWELLEMEARQWHSYLINRGNAKKQLEIADFLLEIRAELHMREAQEVEGLRILEIAIA